jgi:hypothetical protein
MGRGRRGRRMGRGRVVKIQKIKPQEVFDFSIKIPNILNNIYAFFQTAYL